MTVLTFLVDIGRWITVLVSYINNQAEGFSRTQDNIHTVFLVFESYWVQSKSSLGLCKPIAATSTRWSD